MADNNAQEPSMEEILASIRRIISEDDGDETNNAPAEAADAEQALEEMATESTEAAEEVLELSDEDILDAEPEPVEESVTPAPEAVQQEADVLELTDAVEPAAATVADGDADKPKAAPILSEQSAERAAEPFSQLSGLLVRDYQGAENTLDGLMREMLRPILKEWLDAHLPNVVERMVAKEIARLTNRD